MSNIQDRKKIVLSTEMMKIPCTLEKFQEWLNIKRIFGLLTLKTRIEDMLRAKKTCIIGDSKGGEVKDIITLYYNNDIMTQDTMKLTDMHDKIINLKYKHAKETIDQYQRTIGQNRSL